MPLADFSDIYPTVCELAGIAPPANHRLEGQSFAGYLRGKPGATPPREWILNEYHETRVVRDVRFKLYSDGRFFDANADPEEQHDLASSTDLAVAAARKRLEKVLASLPADAPPPFPLRSLSAFKIHGDSKHKP
jgi:arylsulfatase A